jgi:threonine synthase
MSPSMDIEVSSNFERYLFEVQGRDAGLIRDQMASLGHSGRFKVRGGARVMSKDFAAASATEKEVADMIRAVRLQTGYLADPHTGCALVAVEKTKRTGSAPVVVLATAHPAKFPDAMEACVAERPSLPPRLSSLMTSKEKISHLPNDLTAIEQFIANRARSMSEHTS